MNAKDEFLEEIGGKPKLKCANIKLEVEYDKYKIYSLPIGFTNKQFDEYLASLDFEYDDGYGGQELYGNIWFEDGTWCERHEYDGSECWHYKKCPTIPKEDAPTSEAKNEL
jgi:hypothetical protein